MYINSVYIYIYIYSVYINSVPIYICTHIVCIYIYTYVCIHCLSRVTTGAVDTCVGEADDHSTSGVVARRSLMFGQTEHSLNMTDIPWSLKRNLTTL